MNSLPRLGYFIQLCDDNPNSNHVFCGENHVPNAMCPNCKKPLLQYFSLDVTDARLNLNIPSLRFLPLLYCWTCGIVEDDFIYQVYDGGIKILHYGKGGCTKSFPYRGYPVFFPASRVQLNPLTPLQQSLIARCNREDVNKWLYEVDYDALDEIYGPRHQIGGEPFLIQSLLPHALICPICTRDMYFLAAFSDENTDPRGFAEEDWVQVIYLICPHCILIRTYNQMD